MVCLRKTIAVIAVMFLSACANMQDRNKDTTVIDRMSALSRDGQQCSNKPVLESNLSQILADSHLVANDARYIIAMPHVNQVQYVAKTLLRNSQDNLSTYNACYFSMRIIHTHVESIKEDSRNQ